MTDLSQQTDQLLKALTTLHNDLGALNTTCIAGFAACFALLLIIVFRRRP
jgi:hypothetical protein